MSNPIITIEMEDGGIIKAELYPEIAPNTPWRTSLRWPVRASMTG